MTAPISSLRKNNDILRQRSKKKISISNVNESALELERSDYCVGIYLEGGRSDRKWHEKHVRFDPLSKFKFA